MNIQNSSNKWDYRRSKGFTLLELLLCIAVISIMITASVFAVGKMQGAGRFNQTISGLGGILDYARQYAVAQNTYVWVAFSETQGDVDKSLNVAVLASLDGTDPSPWTDYGTVPSQSIQLIQRVRSFSHVNMEEAGSLGVNQVPSLPTTPTIDVNVNKVSDTASFSIKLPGSATATKFSRVIQFTPSGEARNRNGTVDIIEFGLTPRPETSSANVAVVRVSGLMGVSRVYRP